MHYVASINLLDLWQYANDGSFCNHKWLCMINFMINGTLYFNEISDRFSASHKAKLLPLPWISGSFDSSLSTSVTCPHWSAHSAEKCTMDSLEVLKM